MAWLLATSRILGVNADLAHQESFAAALRAQGFAVDNSRISRWESGAKPLPTKVITAYENLLGFPDGGLVAVAAGVYRARGSITAPPRRTRPELRTQIELDDLFALAETGDASGADWLRMAEDLSHFERVYLNPATWRTLATQLINELSRSVGAGYVRRQEACQILLTNPVAQRHLVRAIGEVVTNPQAQVVQPALNLLSGLEDPAAGALVLRLIESDSPLLRRTAAGIAPAKLARKHFTANDMPRLESFAIRSIRGANSMSAGLHAIDLAATLPESSFNRVCAEVRDSHQSDRLRLARSQGQLVPLETSRGLARTIASRAQEETGTPFATEPDTMLQRLVSEALFHAHKERRTQAGLLIGASAYAQAVAHGCLALAEESSEFVGGRALAILQTIGLGTKRDLALRHAVTASAPASARVRALNALAVCREPMSASEADAVQRLTADDHPTAVRQSALFSVGMNAPERIAELRNSTDQWVAGRANWWADHGSALRDNDDLGDRRQAMANPAWIPAPRRQAVTGA